MNIYKRAIVVGILLSALGSIQDCLGAGAPPPVRKGMMGYLKEWPRTTAAVGGLALYAGYGLLSSYTPDSLAVPVVIAGACGLGAHYLPKLKLPGLWRVASDLNTIAEKDGLKGVVRQGAKDFAGGIGEGLQQDLAAPTIKEIKEELGPSLNTINDGLKNMGFTLLKAGAGLIALWYGAKVLNGYFETYFNKPRLDVVVKKAPQNGTIGLLNRQIIVEEATRDRLNLFLHTNLKVKQSLMSGNEESRYRTGLLWGPSGCGKRMFAQEMANFARMDYYEVPWSSFLKFKDGEASRAIEEFFKHEVIKSQNGAVVYIDNAQMLFNAAAYAPGVPSQLGMIRSALIENIEARSSKFIVIFGMTSKPVLTQDTALLVDDIIEVSLPKLAERKRLLKYYRDLYFKTEAVSEESAQLADTILGDATLENLAKRLDKASSAEIASFMNTLKIEAMLPTSEGLTPGLIDQLINRSEHRLAATIG
jgi:hypothetical protein